MLHTYCIDIRYINFEALRAAGFKAVLFDKDNTLTLPYSPTVHNPLRPALLECLDIFSPNRIAILSNSSGTSDEPSTVSISVEDRIIPVIPHDSRFAWRKPLNGHRVIRHFGVSPAQIVVVGDRLSTDILMGNRLGMLTIHTRTLSEQNDNTNAVLIRRWEHWVLDRMLPRPYSREDLQSRFIRKIPFSP